MTHRFLLQDLDAIYQDIRAKERELDDLMRRARELEAHLEADELKAKDREYQRDRV